MVIKYHIPHFYMREPCFNASLSRCRRIANITNQMTGQHNLGLRNKTADVLNPSILSGRARFSLIILRAEIITDELQREHNN
jgi:hypothetical protein